MHDLKTDSDPIKMRSLFKKTSDVHSYSNLFAQQISVEQTIGLPSSSVTHHTYEYKMPSADTQLSVRYAGGM